MAAELLQTNLSARRVVELAGTAPRRVDRCGEQTLRPDPRPSCARGEAVPRESWESLFRSQGMKNPEPRMQMLDGFMEAGSTSRAARLAPSRANPS